MSLEEAVLTALRANKDHTQKTVWLAMSGGIDSVVLAHILFQLKERLSQAIKVIHINHQLSVHANDWAQHVQALCVDYGFPCTVKKVTLPSRKNVEALARTLRYEAIYQAMQAGDILLTAHHANDQIETFFLNALRGAGLEGLTAMPACQIKHGIEHRRPLLEVTRDSLLIYAKGHDLKWHEDDSNEDLNLQRNFLRQKIWPLLQARYPGAEQSILRSVELLQSVRDNLDDYVHEDYQSCALRGNKRLSLQSLKALPAKKRALVLRHWFRLNQIQMPTKCQLDNILKTFIEAKRDKLPQISWGQITLHRYRDQLFFIPSNLPDVREIQLVWITSQPLVLPAHLGQLVAGGFSEAGSFTVRFQSIGERIHLRSQHRSLKKCYQDYGIPPCLRAYVPLIYDESGQLLCAADLLKSDNFFKRFGVNAHISWYHDRLSCVADFFESSI